MAQSVMDPSLQRLHPDKHVDLKLLFESLNQRFFSGILYKVDVAWSPRLKTIGGYCSFNENTQFCYIRLNESAYCTAPRSNLVGALLHEMIHAALDITHEPDDGDHGTKFCWVAEQINNMLGSNIKVPLTWDNDPDVTWGHWWQCNGPCQETIKRAINRPPSDQEKWWAHHQNTCGGTYVKVKEPENYSKKGKRKRKTSKSSDPALSVGEGSQEHQHPKRHRVTEDI